MKRDTHDSRRLWQRFEDTGEIGAYLLYRALSAAQRDRAAGERGRECRSSVPPGS